MGALGVMRAAMAGLLLAPALVVANDTGSAAADVQPMPAQASPAASPVVAPQLPVWLQMVPVAGPGGVYWIPVPAVSWPVAPQYPAPIPLPYPAYAGERPNVWMPAPVPAQAPAPVPGSAGVDYGPVADTPVVELPVFDATPDSVPVPAPAEPAGAALAPATPEPAKPVESSATETVTPESTATAGVDQPSPAAEVPTSVVPASLTTVDYGPVAPTPVVDLLAAERQAAAPRPRKKAQVAPKPLQPASNAPATAAPASPAPTASQPAKKRLCWNKGVVAPCR